MADFNANLNNDPSQFYKDPATGTTYASADIARQYGVQIPATVVRYTTPAASPTPTATATATAAPTPPTLGTVDEAAIRKSVADSMQGQIDAINANYANLVSQENAAGVDRAGQTRAISARSGTLGSDFGVAAATKTDQFNKQQVKSLQDEQQAKIAAVTANIEDRASQAIQDQRSYNLQKYQVDTEAFQKARDAARSDLQTLASANVNFDPNNPAHQALLKQAGYDQPTGELLWNSLKNKANQVDYQYNAQAGMFMGVDPVTHELKTIQVPGAGPQADAVLGLLTKYPDAGIKLSDTLEAAAAKVKTSAVFRKDNYIAPSGGSGVGGGTGSGTTSGSSIMDPVTDAAVAGIIADNPGEWGHAADAIDQQFGKGTATKYDSWLTDVYKNGKNINDIYHPADYGGLSGINLSRVTSSANRIVSNYVNSGTYKVVSEGAPYLSRIAAASANPGSVSDTELLDSVAKLNTGGNQVTETQIKTITGGKSLSDTVNVLQNKLKNGGVLSDNQRQQLKELANATYQKYLQDYQPIYSQATAQLRAAGIPEQYWTIPNWNVLVGRQQAASSGNTADSGAGDVNSILSKYGIKY